jgi:hypothetical protein
MKPRPAHPAVHIERLLTTAGVHLAGAALLALLLCAAGLRSVDTLFGDWAVLAAALLPAMPRTSSFIAPLFQVPFTASGAAVGQKATPAQRRAARGNTSVTAQ